ncbi:MAG: hypothetical protein MJ117_05340 [Lachnospiraceae bacterium]|nr:hypothetical protein [Lachnospiraceae bacterium]
MNNKRKLAILTLLGLTLLSLPGCGKSSQTTGSSSVSASSEDGSNSVNENITTVSTYYEEPAEEANTGDAEGYIPEDIPEGTVVDAEIGKEFIFHEQGHDAYAVSIDKAEFTDRRSSIPGMEAEQVLLITYSYRSLEETPHLVDDMSFRLFKDEEAMENYYVDEQLMGDVAGSDPVTAEICFAVPKDAKEFSLFVVDNAQADNENYLLLLDMK